MDFYLFICFVLYHACISNSIRFMYASADIEIRNCRNYLNSVQLCLRNFILFYFFLSYCSSSYSVNCCCVCLCVFFPYSIPFVRCSLLLFHLYFSLFRTAASHPGFCLNILVLKSSKLCK